MNNQVSDKVWSIKEQEDCLNNFYKIKTLGEYREFVKKTDMRLFLQISSSYPVNFSKIDYSPINVDGFTFSKIAEVKKFNLEHLSSYIRKKCSSITLENKFYPNDEYNTNDEKTVNLYGFNKLPHIIKIDENNLGIIYKWAKNFQLENYDVQIRYAMPGSVHPAHTDSLDNIWGTDTSIEDKKFYHLTKSPQGYYAVRLLIALNDWIPGQVVGFENNIWTYKTGDVIAFEWSNARHYTANLSWAPRMVLRVTGITKDPNHWIFQNINNKKITNL